MYLSDIDQYPEVDLEGLMGNVIDTFPDEFRDYWGLDSEHVPEHLDVDTWERCRELDNLARRVSVLAAALVRPSKLRENDLHAPLELRTAAREGRAILTRLVNKILAEYPDDHDLRMKLHDLRVAEDVDYKFFHASLQLWLSDYLVGPGVLADAVVQLTRYVARVRSQRAIQYLSRVSRCYLYDMTPELAVMSRGALEALLEEALPEDQVRAVRGIPKHLRVGLADYIEVASGTILSDSAATAARRVKQYGDDTVHFSTEAVGSADEILRQLVTVLEGIQDPG